MSILFESRLGSDMVKQIYKFSRPKNDDDFTQNIFLEKYQRLLLNHKLSNQYIHNLVKMNVLTNGKQRNHIISYSLVSNYTYSCGINSCGIKGYCFKLGSLKPNPDDPNYREYLLKPLQLYIWLDDSFNPLEIIVSSKNGILISRYNIEDGWCIGIGRVKKYNLTESYKEEFNHLTNTIYPINKNYIGFNYNFSLREELNTGEKRYWGDLLEKIIEFTKETIKQSRLKRNICLDRCSKIYKN